MISNHKKLIHHIGTSENSRTPYFKNDVDSNPLKREMTFAVKKHALEGQQYLDNMRNLLVKDPEFEAKVKIITE
jgi:hypothetical protein